MLIIPVLDLKGGVVVSAYAGHRSCYQPVQSMLSCFSDPISILSALYQLYPFQVVYIADLDALEAQGHQYKHIYRLVHQFPKVQFWIDAGECGIEYHQHLSKTLCRFIFGSESLDSLATLVQYQAIIPEMILSLDFNSHGFIGDADLLANPKAWPQDVIIMSLDRVGTDKGMDKQRWQEINNLKPSSRYYIAGGVSAMSEFNYCAKHHVDGVLIASMLHQKKIDAQTIEYFMNENE